MRKELVNKRREFRKQISINQRIIDAIRYRDIVNSNKAYRMKSWLFRYANEIQPMELRLTEERYKEDGIEIDLEPVIRKWKLVASRISVERFKAASKIVNEIIRELNEIKQQIGQ